MRGKVPVLPESGFGFGGWGATPPLAWPPLVWPPSRPGKRDTSFAAGTRLLTTKGEIAVENIALGDVLVTARDSGPEIRPVVWTGKRVLDVNRHPQPEMAWPIRIVAGAFDSGLPARDLRLSPGHGIYVDGVLIAAGHLVNGATIIQERGTTHVTYHHVELDQHDIILADGLPAESFPATADRALFEEQTAARPAAGHDNGACAALVADGEVLGAVRARLKARAALLGFTTDEDGEAPAMIARASGRTFTAMPHGGTLAFTLPAGALDVELISPGGSTRPGRPSQAGPDAWITGLTLVAGGRRITIPLDAAGTRDANPTGPGHRASDRAARFALPPHDGPSVLEVATAPYAPLAQPAAALA